MLACNTENAPQDHARMLFLSLSLSLSLSHTHTHTLTHSHTHSHVPLPVDVALLQLDWDELSPDLSCQKRREGNRTEEYRLESQTYCLFSRMGVAGCLHKCKIYNACTIQYRNFKSLQITCVSYENLPTYRSYVLEPKMAHFG